MEIEDTIRAARNRVGELLITLGTMMSEGEELTVRIDDYEGSTALIVQNSRNTDLRHVFYISKWEAPCDVVIERLEGVEYSTLTSCSSCAGPINEDAYDEVQTTEAER